MSDNPVPSQFNLVTKNMAAAVAFYHRLGLTISDTVPDFQDHHRSVEASGGIDVDFDSVEFARHWDHGWAGGMGVLNFTVGSRQRVDGIYADVVGAGYRGQQEPYDAFWGARYAVAQDPDGNAIGIMRPIDHERRGDPGFP
ncbi:MAG: VOC family protein [Acidimicrobiales bacterium]